MKKILALALALMMVLALAACGGKTDPAPSGNGTTDPGTSQTTDPGTSQQGGADENTPADSVDVSTLNGFLSQFGLTEDDIKPSECFASFEYDGRMAQIKNLS